MRRAAILRIDLKAGIAIGAIRQLALHQVVACSPRPGEPLALFGMPVEVKIPGNNALIAPIQARTSVGQAIAPPVNNRAAVAMWTAHCLQPGIECSDGCSYCAVVVVHRVPFAVPTRSQSGEHLACHPRTT